MKQKNSVLEKKIALLLVDNNYMFDDNDKIDTIVDNYGKVSLMYKYFGSVSYNKNIEFSVKKYPRNNIVDNNSVKLTNEFEITKLIFKLKNKKAPGNDGIT